MVMVGASLTGEILSGMLRVACSLVAVPVKSGSAPVLPLSLMLTVKFTVPLALRTVLYSTPVPVEIKALIAAKVPVSVSIVAVPPTVTPAPETAESVPAGTV